MQKAEKEIAHNFCICLKTIFLFYAADGFRRKQTMADLTWIAQAIQILEAKDSRPWLVFRS